MQGRVVLITGAARGIGLATAEAFAASGATVAIGDIDGDLASRSAAALAARTDATVVGVRVDVTDRESFAGFFAEAETLVGAADILINNAGIMPTGYFVDESPGLTDRQIDINVRGVTNGSRLAATRFLERGTGHIVNIASVAAITAEAGLATYCGTKHFVLGFTEALRRELHPHGVGVTVVLPGFINTELSAGTVVPRWAHALACREPEDVAAGIVAAVRADSSRVTVPASLGLLIKSMALLPERASHAIQHALNFDTTMTGADPEQRAAYHRRITGTQ
ncbi:SDR family oxidoreductase [Antrihabitans cavernicola]|uniref:SDR family oxidoreductase n=1 Tax=Antrihabitans cavernicola TaxID=2495913 RepID=A0A5A7S7W1_9NOCA|nr:SDR family oxidoreductase [Spelaeibacter cavernicola]